MNTNFETLRWHLQKLPHFHMAAKLGSIRLAAKHLKISQPSLSKSIRSLEIVCGTPLFSRGRNGVRLTPQGEVLFRFSERLRLETEAVARDMEMSSTVSPPIRFATHELFVPRIFPSLFGELVKQNSGIAYTLRTETSSAALIRMIATGEIDIGLVVEGRNTKGLHRLELIEDTYHWYASRVFLKAHKRKPAYNPPFIYAPGVTATATETIAEYMRRMNIEIPTIFNVSSIESVSALVNGHLGIGLLPERFGRHLRDEGVELVRPSDFEDDCMRKESFGSLTMFLYYGDSMKNQPTALKKIEKIVRSILS